MSGAVENKLNYKKKMTRNIHTEPQKHTGQTSKICWRVMEGVTEEIVELNLESKIGWS